MSSATSGDMSQRQTYSTWQEFGELSGKHRLWQQVAEFERAEEARTWISAVMSDDQVPDVLGSSADVRADLSAITDAGASVGQLSSYPTMTAHDAAVHQRTLDSEERRPRSEDFSTAHVIHAISARTSGRSSERAGGVHALKCRRIAHDEAPRHLLERAASGRKNRRRGSADHHAPPTPNAVRPASPLSSARPSGSRGIALAICPGGEQHGTERFLIDAVSRAVAGKALGARQAKVPAAAPASGGAAGSAEADIGAKARGAAAPKQINQAAEQILNGNIVGVAPEALPTAARALYSSWYLPAELRGVSGRAVLSQQIREVGGCSVRTAAIETRVGALDAPLPARFDLARSLQRSRTRCERPYSTTRSTRRAATTRATTRAAIVGMSRPMRPAALRATWLQPCVAREGWHPRSIPRRTRASRSRSSATRTAVPRPISRTDAQYR